MTQQAKSADGEQDRLRNEAVHEYLYGHGSVEDQFGQGFDKGWQAGRSSLESENATLQKDNRINLAVITDLHGMMKKLGMVCEDDVWRNKRAEAAESENARLREVTSEAITMLQLLCDGRNVTSPATYGKAVGLIVKLRTALIGGTKP